MATRSARILRGKENTSRLIIPDSLQLNERKQIKKTLRESEEKYRSLFENARDTIILADTETGIIVDVNTAGCHLLGLPREKIVGLHQSKIHPPAMVEKYKQIFHDHVEKGTVITDDIVIQRADGAYVPVDISVNIVKMGEKSIIQGIFRDITERKQAENKLKEAMVNLEHSTAQLKATNTELESFSYSVSHDLRSPLRSIDGFSQALLEDYAGKLDETGRDYLNRLRSASQKMGELIDGLLKLSRLTRNEMHLEKVDLSALAEEISTRLQETHPERHGKFIINSGLSADGDPQMVRVLLENLLGNAWKFTGKTPQARIEFGSTTNGSGKTFFIKDNGAGFDMAYQHKLFVAFQRLHNTADFPGTGIGLATVQRIINRHGGSIRAEGAVGKGAAFYFTLS